MYDIGKMQYEKAKQMERRAKVDKYIHTIKEFDKKWLIMKICAAIWLVFLNPIIANCITDGDLKQCNTIITVLAVIILVIRQRDIKN